MWRELEGPSGPLQCRDVGEGPNVLVYLHSGWGYDIYPFEQQIEALGPGFRVLSPDRSGYGRSGRGSEPLPLDFHERGARDTLAILDALGVEEAMLWGHSDGACISARLSLLAPERLKAMVLEAFHLYRVKPGSRAFFEAMIHDPESFGGGVMRVLAAEHGEDYWRELLRFEGDVWLRLAELSSPHADLYEGRLGEVATPTLVLHGAGDPRTEPGELDAAVAAIPTSELALIEGGRHCPHAEPDVGEEATQVACAFLARHAVGA